MNSRRLLVFLIALSVFAVDRYSKWLIESSLGPFDSKPVIPGFLNIVSSRNPGVAFGFFSDSSYAGSTNTRTILLIIFSLAAVAILAVLLWRTNRTDLKTSLGLACIFGGALGNVFDRIRTGSVTDFIDAYIGEHHWYTFNVADTAICIGAALLLLAIRKTGNPTLHAA